MFWIARYFSTGARATRPAVRAEAAPSRMFRKAGEAEMSALFMAAAAAPIGGIESAMFLEVCIVDITKPWNIVFHRCKSKVAVGTSVG